LHFLGWSLLSTCKLTILIAAQICPLDFLDTKKLPRRCCAVSG